MEEIKMEDLRELLQEIRPDIDFDVDAKLIDDGILDSIDVIAIVTTVSDNFDIDISVQYLIPENFNSVEAIYNLICKLQDE